MTHFPPLSVFIGSGDASRIPEKVLCYALTELSAGEIEISILDGTNEMLHTPGGHRIPFQFPQTLRNLSFTEFTFCRFLIPHLTANKGTVLYLDSDVIPLRDPRNVLQVQNPQALFQVTQPQGNRRNLGVMLVNCSHGFPLEEIVREIENSRITSTDLIQLSEKLIHRFDIRLGELPYAWNALDRANEKTQILHYTRVHRQPWRAKGHPFGSVWFGWLTRAIAAGVLTAEEIQDSIRRGYVRPDLLSPREGWLKLWASRRLSRIYSRAIPAP